MHLLRILFALSIQTSPKLDSFPLMLLILHCNVNIRKWICALVLNICQWQKNQNVFKPL